MAPLIRVPSNSCQSIVIHGTNAVEQRCYPLLVNFADRCCQKAQKKNCLTGMQYGIQQCALYNKNSLDNNPNFVYRNRNLLNRKRGAGYWLWKPYIILQELYYAREGDIIVYSDALVNFVANISHLTRLTDRQDIVLFELTGLQEKVWAKRDTFILMNADEPRYTDTWGNLASYLVIKKSFISMTFVSEWLTYAQDTRAITDDNNVLGQKNYREFRDHRHDQTIMSILSKKWNITAYPDPSQFGIAHKRPYPSIFDHHRTRDTFE
ncbi:unnamed protein product [Adineta ricciae]|uniref:Uncharacterized protein n=1 Tax=Adineta ricciae TaxID=249248 RepID=A0A815HIQ8_ADIRI|nr:unnamed protein product [Adineta ricciae]CAF1352948.1 unnamed protein product [Adineta ricciae]